MICRDSIVPPEARPIISVQLLAAVVEDAAGHDEQIYLLSALEDIVDLRVAHPLLDQCLARVTKRTEQLDRLLRDLRDRLAGLRLGHRSFEVITHPHVEHPRRAPR